MTTPDRPQLLSVRQAAEEFPALGELFLRRLIFVRRIAYHRVGGKVLLDRRDIEALIDAGRVEAVG